MYPCCCTGTNRCCFEDCEYAENAIADLVIFDSSGVMWTQTDPSSWTTDTGCKWDVDMESDETTPSTDTATVERLETEWKVTLDALVITIPLEPGCTGFITTGDELEVTMSGWVDCPDSNGTDCSGYKYAVLNQKMTYNIQKEAPYQTSEICFPEPTTCNTNTNSIGIDSHIGYTAAPDDDLDFTITATINQTTKVWTFTLEESVNGGANSTILTRGSASNGNTGTNTYTGDCELSGGSCATGEFTVTIDWDFNQASTTASFNATGTDCSKDCCHNYCTFEDGQITNLSFTDGASNTFTQVGTSSWTGSDTSCTHEVTVEELQPGQSAGEGVEHTAVVEWDQGTYNHPPSKAWYFWNVSIAGEGVDMDSTPAGTNYFCASGTINVSDGASTSGSFTFGGGTYCNCCKDSDPDCVFDEDAISNLSGEVVIAATAYTFSQTGASTLHRGLTSDLDYGRIRACIWDIPVDVDTSPTTSTTFSIFRGKSGAADAWSMLTTIAGGGGGTLFEQTDDKTGCDETSIAVEDPLNSNQFATFDTESIRFCNDNPISMMMQEAIIEETGSPIEEDCGCSDAGALMNRWGIEKSIERKDRLIKHLTRRKKLTKEQAESVFDKTIAKAKRRMQGHASP